MQAVARQAACAAQRSGLLRQAVLPGLTFQVTSLSSLAGPSRGCGEQCWPAAPTAAAATAAVPGSWGAATSALTLCGQQQQQQRALFNFAGFGGDLSKNYQEKKLLGWTPRQVYDVVAAVEHYHHFVPWCQGSRIMLRRPPGYLEAELEVGFKMFVERYTSKVTLHCPTAVHSRVDDSTLFTHLTNKWEFRAGPTPHTTWLTFEVDFAFKSPLYSQVASIFFEEVVQRMMGAFEGRCAKMYGPSSLHRRPGPAQQVASGSR